MDFILKIVGSPATGTRLLNLGETDALAYFPLHQMMATMTTTINSSSISSNIPDILPALIKLHDKRSLQKYNSLTPNMTDNYFDYAQASATGANNNPLLTYSNAGYDNSFQPNGAFRPIGFGTDALASNGVVPQAGDGTEKTYYVKYRCVEPLLFLSPFVYSTESNSQGLYGVQNMNFQFQFGNIQRVWRSSAGFDKTITLQDVSTSYLDFVFINSHPSDLLPSKNVVPYIEYPRYISPQGNGTLATDATFRFTSQSLSLNVVPDKLVLFLRNRNDLTSKRCVPDRFLTIENVAINFNNSSGILSTAQKNALFEISAENGLAVSYQEFDGVAAGAPLTNGIPAKVALCGAPVVLCMGKDIQLVQDYIASGAIGNFNLQITGECRNQGADTLPANSVELVIIAINSGIVVVEQGVSSVYTGILTKEDVLKASDQGGDGFNVMGWNQYVRMTGAGLLDQIKTIGVKGLKMAQPLIEGSKLGELAKKVSGGRKMGANRLM
jgi:hypothetical protein